MLPKKFMHHHNDHNYATMRSTTETNQEKIAPRKFGCNPRTEDQDPDDTCGQLLSTIAAEPTSTISL